MINKIGDLITIHKYNKKEVSNSLLSASTIALLFALVVMLSTSYLASSWLPFVFAADKEFDIDVDIKKDPIKRGDTQDITVTVRNDDTGKRISDADVRLTVYPPDSDSTSATDDTDDDGKAEFKVKIDDGAETGKYDVKIRVSKDGYDTKTVNTSFDVIKKHHHDDDDDDRDGDGNGSAAASAASSGSSSAAAAASGNSAASAAASLSAAAAAAAAGGGSSAAAAFGGSSAAAAAVSN